MTSQITSKTKLRIGESNKSGIKNVVKIIIGMSIKTENLNTTTKPRLK
jgi:hypothetical protein